MTLLISDANVLIDIEDAALTKDLFRLSYQFAVPDVLFEEELKERHSHLPRLGLQILILRSEYVVKMIDFAKRYRKPSRNDLFALCLALQEEATLLTGDRSLREVAKIEDVPFRGTIWLVSQMVEQKIIHAERAYHAFQKMQASGSRLPQKEIGEALVKFGVDF